MSEGNLFIENVSLDNNFISNNDVFNVKNVYVNNFTAKNVTLKDNASGNYKSVFNLAGTVNPIAYLKGVNISNDANNTPIMKSVVETNYVYGVNDRKVFFDNTNLKSINTNGSLLALDKFSYKSNDMIGRGNDVYFKGTNSITSCVTEGARSLINVVPKVVFEGDKSYTDIKENTVKIVSEADKPHSILDVQSGMTISGILSVANNVFNPTVAVSTYSSAIDYVNRKNRITFKDGGLTVKDNITTSPGSMRVRQLNFTYNMALNDAGVDVSDAEHKNACQNNPLLYVEGGYKFKSADSQIYIYTNDLSRSIMSSVL